MKHRRLLLSLVVATQLGGCAYITTIGKEPVERVDYWIEQKEYGKALAVIEQAGPSHPDYTRLKERKERLAPVIRRFEREILHESRKLANEGKLGEALQRLETGLDRLPQSHALQSALAQTRQKRLGLREELQLALALRRGEWLAAVLPVHRRLAEMDPDDRQTHRLLTEREEEGKQVARNLFALGMSASQKGRHREAREALTLSQQLEDSSQTRRALAKLEKAQHKRVTKVRRAQEQAQQEKRERDFGRLLDEYHSAHGQQDYPACIRLMGEIEDLAPENVEVRQLRLELDAVVEERVTQYMDRAGSEYSRGQIEQAIEHWRKALALDPANEQILSHIKRAEKVLEKLGQLRAKQSR